MYQYLQKSINLSTLNDQTANVVSSVNDLIKVGEFEYTIPNNICTIFSGTIILPDNCFLTIPDNAPIIGCSSEYRWYNWKCLWWIS